MFHYSKDGSTHYANDGCGDPAHNSEETILKNFDKAFPNPWYQGFNEHLNGKNPTVMPSCQFRVDFLKDFLLSVLQAKEKEVREKAKNEWQTRYFNSVESLKKEERERIAREVEKIPDTEPLAECNDYDSGLQVMKSKVLSIINRK